jgi:hypothetical protein
MKNILHPIITTLICSKTDSDISNNDEGSSTYSKRKRSDDKEDDKDKDESKNKKTTEKLTTDNNNVETLIESASVFDQYLPETPNQHIQILGEFNCFITKFKK